MSLLDDIECKVTIFTSILRFSSAASKQQQAEQKLKSHYSTLNMTEGCIRYALTSKNEGDESVLFLLEIDWQSEQLYTNWVLQEKSLFNVNKELVEAAEKELSLLKELDYLEYCTRTPFDKKVYGESCFMALSI